MQEIYRKAGIKIRHLREINRYTRDEFARKVEITPKFLYEIETGKKGFSADTLYRITQGLSVTAEYILAEDISCNVVDDVVNVLGLFEQGDVEKVLKFLELVYDIVQFK